MTKTARNILIASIASVTAIAAAAIGAVVYVHKSLDTMKLDKFTD